MICSENDTGPFGVSPEVFCTIFVFFALSTVQPSTAGVCDLLLFEGLGDFEKIRGPQGPKWAKNTETVDFSGGGAHSAANNIEEQDQKEKEAQEEEEEERKEKEEQ